MTELPGPDERTVSNPIGEKYDSRLRPSEPLAGSIGEPSLGVDPATTRGEIYAESRVPAVGIGNLTSEPVPTSPFFRRPARTVVYAARVGTGVSGVIVDRTGAKIADTARPPVEQREKAEVLYDGTGQAATEEALVRASAGGGAGEGQQAAAKGPIPGAAGGEVVRAEEVTQHETQAGMSGGTPPPGREPPSAAGFSDPEGTNGNPAEGADSAAERPLLVPQVRLFRSREDVPELDRNITNYREQVYALIRQGYSNQAIARVMRDFSPEDQTEGRESERREVRHFSPSNIQTNYRIPLLEAGEDVPVHSRIREEARRRIAEGYPVEEVARVYGYSINTVQTMSREIFPGTRIGVRGNPIPIEVQLAGYAFDSAPISRIDVAQRLGIAPKTVYNFMVGKSYVNLDSLYDAAIAAGANPDALVMKEIDQQRRNFNALLFFSQAGMTFREATRYLRDSIGLGKEEAAEKAGLSSSTIRDIINDGRYEVLREIPRRKLIDTAGISGDSKAAQLYYLMRNRFGEKICTLDEFLEKSFGDQVKYFLIAHAYSIRYAAQRIEKSATQVEKIKSGTGQLRLVDLGKLIGTENRLLIDIMSQRQQGNNVTLSTDQRRDFINDPHTLLVTEHIEQARRFIGR